MRTLFLKGFTVETSTPECCHDAWLRKVVAWYKLSWKFNNVKEGIWSQGCLKGGCIFVRMHLLDIQLGCINRITHFLQLRIWNGLKSCSDLRKFIAGIRPHPQLAKHAVTIMLSFQSCCWPLTKGWADTVRYIGQPNPCSTSFVKMWISHLTTGVMLLGEVLNEVRTGEPVVMIACGISPVFLRDHHCYLL